MIDHFESFSELKEKKHQNSLSAEHSQQASRDTRITHMKNDMLLFISAETEERTEIK